ncbi:MAG TPA: hypothetical protein VKE41_21840 [Roseiflexaceae bacterium]|nr:hypothetical protein [Roseiflexaceae bacterium]
MVSARANEACAQQNHSYAIFGFITATIASYFADQDRVAMPALQGAPAGELAALHDAIAALRVLLVAFQA